MAKFWTPIVKTTCTIGTLVWIVRNSDFCYSDSNMADATYKLFTSRMVSFYLADAYPLICMIGLGLSCLELFTQLLHHGLAVEKEGIIHAVAFFAVGVFPVHPTKPHIREMEMDIPHYVAAGIYFMSFVAYMARAIRKINYTATNEETLDQLDDQQIRNIRLTLSLWRYIFKVYVTGLVIFLIGYFYLKMGTPKCNPDTSKEMLHHFIIGEWIVVYATSCFYAPFALLHNVDMITTGKDDRILLQRTRTEIYATEEELSLSHACLAEMETISLEDPGFASWFGENAYLKDLHVPEETAEPTSSKEPRDSKAPVQAPHHMRMTQLISRVWTLQQDTLDHDLVEEKEQLPEVVN